MKTCLPGYFSYQLPTNPLVEPFYKVTKKVDNIKTVLESKNLGDDFMDFEHMENLAFQNSSMPNGLLLEEQNCFLLLQDLYREYRAGRIGRNEGKQKRNRIRRAFEDSSVNRNQQFAMYAQYQENIRQAQHLKHELIKGARDGLPVESLLDIACKIIAAMTGEDTSYKLIMKSLEERTI